MKRKQIAFIGGVVALLIAGGLLYAPMPAQADGVCLQRKNQPAGPIPTIDICERNANGPSEVSDPVSAGNATPGYIVLMECGDATKPSDQLNVANWSDVVHVYQPSGQTPIGSIAQLFSQGSNFPKVDIVMQANHVFQRETQNGAGNDDLDFTTVPYGSVIFSIHSAARNAPCDPPAQVPEGDTLMLVGTGLAGLAGYATLRWRARRATDVARSPAPKA